jgi:hypothetical protein
VSISDFSYALVETLKLTVSALSLSQKLEEGPGRRPKKMFMTDLPPACDLLMDR